MNDSEVAWRLMAWRLMATRLACALESILDSEHGWDRWLYPRHADLDEANHALDARLDLIDAEEDDK